MKEYTKLQNSFSYKDFPKILYKFPIILKFIHLLTLITTSRTWAVKSILKKVISQNKIKNVADIGYGTGDYIFEISKSKNINCYGYEVSDANIILAQEFRKFLKQENMEFVNGEFPNNSKIKFDLVLLVTVLQYIKDDEDLLRRVKNNLNGNGVLLLYSPINYKRIFWISSYFEKKEDFDHDAIIKRAHTYSEYELKLKIENSGLQIIKKKYVYGFIGKIGYEVLALLQYKIGKAKMLLPFYILIGIILLPIICATVVFDNFKLNKDGNGLLLLIKQKL